MTDLARSSSVAGAGGEDRRYDAPAPAPLGRDRERRLLERGDARELSTASQSFDRLVDGDLLRKLTRDPLALQQVAQALEPAARRSRTVPHQR
jgi:hypothetical protein